MNHNSQITRPQTAIEILKLAGNTLGERGKQYDPNGKQERSMTAIVQAFNAIYPHNPLTVHMGWQFMSLVKMVRGATNPHADSALDQVAYAALAAEEVATHLHSQEQLREAYAHNPYAGKAAVERKQEAEVDALMKRIRAGYNGCPQCGADVDKEAGSCQCGWEFEEQEEVQPTAAKRVEQLLAYNRSLEVQLDTLRSSFAQYACRFDLSKEYMTKEQVLAGQAKHEAQVSALTDKLAAQQELLTVAQHNANFYFDKTNGCIAANESMTAKFQAERKANVAMHEEVTRLRGKVQELTDLAEYRDKRNAELCAELETQRGKCIAQSSRISELQTLVDNLRSSLAQATKEAPCAHNTDEPKAPRPEYIDPFDQYGDRQPKHEHRIVGGLDPSRTTSSGLSTAPSFGMSSGSELAYPAGKPL